MSELLPKGSSALEHGCENVAIERFSKLGASCATAIVSNPATCAKALLPLLAQSWSVDIEGLQEPYQRTKISNAINEHRYIGTSYAIKTICKASGFGDVEVVDVGLANWWEFAVVVKQPISEYSARLIQSFVNQVKPLHARLVEVRFDKATAVYGASGLNYGSIARYGGVVPLQTTT